MGNLWLNIGEGADVFGCRIQQIVIFTLIFFIFSMLLTLPNRASARIFFLKYTRPRFDGIAGKKKYILREKCSFLTGKGARGGIAIKKILRKGFCGKLKINSDAAKRGNVYGGGFIWNVLKSTFICVAPGARVHKVRS